jgi:hypothetical protein
VDAEDVEDVEDGDEEAGALASEGELWPELG